MESLGERFSANVGFVCLCACARARDRDGARLRRLRECEAEVNESVMVLKDQMMAGV